MSDQGAVLGPITLRHVGYLVAGILEVVVFLAVYRSPTPKTLALGLAASVLVAFMFLTTMHERYSYGALVFLVLLIAERSTLVTLVIFSIAFTLNLLAAAPPTSEIGALLPVGGTLGLIGSLTMFGVTVAVLVMLLRASSEDGDSSEPGEEPRSPDPTVAAT